ncbi:MurR/RpiR family transcriptional regulator [Mycoplasmopsis lipofaciens]|uniref:MurR/RpiR family transcriptional regulator n=1 Tax=Mycoplasmopsis lipofaciens TaxID=114884 RepID=UPI0004806A3A|nr:MurR/RpiR family transcriptional regulator [Mycoplasmopsis lipofaciens]
MTNKNKELIKPYLNLSPELSHSDKSILEYINTFTGDKFTLSQKELALKTHTSEGTISRFVRKMGFENYRAFFAHLNLLIRDFKTQYFNKEYENSINSQKDILLAHKFAIDDILSGTLKWDIDSISRLIHQAQNVYILALGSSQKPAMELAANLLKIGKPCFVCEDFHVFVPILANITSNDLLFIISNKFENLELTFSAQLAKDNNAKIVAVTSNSLVNYKYCFDGTIIYQNIRNTIKEVPISSKVSQILIIDLLFDCLITKYPDYMNKLSRTKNILDRWYKRKFSS